MLWLGKKKIDSRHLAHLRRDLGTIILSILTAILLIQTGSLHQFIILFKDWYILSSFIAGFFFSSIFTAAPAIAMLGELGQIYPVWQVALFGACGSVISDSIIYRFVRDDLDQDLLYLYNLAPHRRLPHIFRTKVFHWVPLLLAGLIIASPLPDELAMVPLGFAKVNRKWFAVISFAFSFLGILIIGSVARAL